MTFNRDLLDNLFLQIIDRVDGNAIPVADIYSHIGKEYKELDGVLFAMSDKHRFIMKHIVETEQLNVMAEALEESKPDAEQSTTTG